MAYDCAHRGRLAEASGGCQKAAARGRLKYSIPGAERLGIEVGASRQDEHTRVVLPTDQAGRRFDQCLAALLDDISRSRIQYWIEIGLVTVDAVPVRASARVRGGEEVVIDAAASQAALADLAWTAEAGTPLSLIYEDTHLLVLDKSAGLVVHPGAGTPGGTLANRLLAEFPELAKVPRAGIVHRLDKDTSGLIVVARTARAHLALSTDIAQRTVVREYESLVWGRVAPKGSVEQPIGRHPRQRIKMAVRPDGRPARTHFRVLRHMHASSHLRLKLDTGRTHQIRVHMEHIGHPIVGDPLYRSRRYQRLPQGIDRQALHAASLGFHHPHDGKYRVFHSVLPEDIAKLIPGWRAQ